MRVFVAGGTGVIGRRLVSQLVARGHQVTATTTSAGKLGLLEQLGAEGVVPSVANGKRIAIVVLRNRTSRWTVASRQMSTRARGSINWLEHHGLRARMMADPAWPVGVHENDSGS